MNIYSILPVTTALAEKNFSSLKRLKTFLKNSTGETRLNGLVLHRDLKVNIDTVIFVDKKEAIGAQTLN